MSKVYEYSEELQEYEYQVWELISALESDQHQLGEERE
jgi:hypothetical protein